MSIGTDMGLLQERITTTTAGSITSVQVNRFLHCKSVNFLKKCLFSLGYLCAS